MHKLLSLKGPLMTVEAKTSLRPMTFRTKNAWLNHENKHNNYYGQILKTMMDGEQAWTKRQQLDRRIA